MLVHRFSLSLPLPVPTPFGHLTLCRTCANTSLTFRSFDLSSFTCTYTLSSFHSLCFTRAKAFSPLHSRCLTCASCCRAPRNRSLRAPTTRCRPVAATAERSGFHRLRRRAPKARAMRPCEPRLLLLSLTSGSRVVEVPNSGARPGVCERHCITLRGEERGRKRMCQK